ncbi:MAG: ATP-dependent RNA helicase RhlB, partial [Xanthomonadaceae bacterium]|nr:ATP-dependent RNA helicase RhlB [Xanthomonadaceae bacterium]
PAAAGWAERSDAIAAVSAAPVADPAGVVRDAAGNVDGEGARKPRRRRGGRNRHRDGVVAGAPEANGQNAVHTGEGNRASRGERRPARERNAAESSGIASRPSRQVEVVSGNARDHAHPNKPSLFRRLTRLFTGR